MAEIEMTQEEADALIAMEKQKADDETWTYPVPGTSIHIPLTSRDKRETFTLDIYRGRIDLSKITQNMRARKVVTLARLDLGNVKHRNPDGEEIVGPHMHIYRAGYQDKWAHRVPSGEITNVTDHRAALGEFMRFCNITRLPNIQWGLDE